MYPQIDRIKELLLLKENQEKDISSEPQEKSQRLTSTTLRNSRNFKMRFSEILKKLFEPTGNWGKADKPEIGCYTNQGVIGVYTFTDYSRKLKVPESNWSVINFFNTSGLVLDSLLEKFRKTTLIENETNFLLFVEDFLKTKLKSKEFEDLVVMNLRAITKGIRGEVSVFNDIIDTLGLEGEMNFCPGSLSDTRKGEDFVLYKEGKSVTVQVKQLFLFSVFDNKTEVVTKKYPSKGYKQNINYIVFFKDTTKEFIILENSDDLKIYNDLKSKKGFEYDKVIFKSLPITPDEMIFR